MSSIWVSVPPLDEGGRLRIKDALPDADAMAESFRRVPATASRNPSLPAVHGR